MVGYRWIGVLAVMGGVVWTSEPAYAQTLGAEAILTQGGQNCVAETGAQETVLFGEPGIGNQTGQYRYIWCPAPRLQHDADRLIGGIGMRFSVPPNAQVECYPFIGTGDLQIQWGQTLRGTPVAGYTWLTWYEPFGLRKMKDIVTSGLRCRLPPGNSWLVGFYYMMSK